MRLLLLLTPAVAWVGNQVRDEERHGHRGGATARVRRTAAAAAQGLGRALVLAKLTMQRCGDARGASHWTFRLLARVTVVLWWRLVDLARGVEPAREMFELVRRIPVVCVHNARGGSGGVSSRRATKAPMSRERDSTFPRRIFCLNNMSKSRR